MMSPVNTDTNVCEARGLMGLSLDCLSYTDLLPYGPRFRSKTQGLGPELMNSKVKKTGLIIGKITNLVTYDFL